MIIFNIRNEYESQSTMETNILFFFSRAFVRSYSLEHTMATYLWCTHHSYTYMLLILQFTNYFIAQHVFFLQLPAALQAFCVNNETWFHLFCAPPDKPRPLLAVYRCLHLSVDAKLVSLATESWQFRLWTQHHLPESDTFYIPSKRYYSI